MSERWVRTLLRALVLVLLTALWVGDAQARVWPTHALRVERDLKSADVERRRRAAQRIAQLSQGQGARLAVVALDDGDLEVKLAAGQAIASRGWAVGGDAAVRWLKSSDVRLRRMACALLERTPSRRGRRALMRALSDVKATVRQDAVRALGRSGGRSVMAALLGQLDDTNPRVRTEVVRALGRIGDARAVVPLASKLSDPEPTVRRQVARVLGAFGDARATVSLVVALRDSEPTVVTAALRALGILRAVDAMPAVVAILEGQGQDSAIHAEAMLALGAMASDEAIARLIRQLGQGRSAVSQGGDVEMQALHLAHAHAPKRLTRQVLSALGATRDGARASRLAQLAGSLALPGAPEAIIGAHRRGLVALPSTVQALRASGHESGLMFLLEHVDASEPDVRRAVVEAAAELSRPQSQDGRVVDVIRSRVLAHKVSMAERLALVRLLGRTGSERARPVLLQLLPTKQARLSVAIAKALATLGRPHSSIDAALLTLLDDAEPSVRAAAGKALGQVGGRAAFEGLLARLGRGARVDRHVVGVALSGAAARAGLERDIPVLMNRLSAASGSLRDGIIEALGRMPVKGAARAVERLAKSPDVNDRRKLAEAFAGRKDSVALSMRLLRDPDAAVRAHAAWAFASMPASDDDSVSRPWMDALVEASKDDSTPVAANAALALAGASAVEGVAVARLCAMLVDRRAYVRLNALVGLERVERRRRGALRCEGTSAEALLRDDRAWRVRGAAARLLQARRQFASKPDEATLMALRQCRLDERHHSVARGCRKWTAGSQGRDDIVVFVVGPTGNKPEPNAPFSLRFADGSLRMGRADRRGAVFTSGAPRGALELVETPAFRH